MTTATMTAIAMTTMTTRTTTEGVRTEVAHGSTYRVLGITDEQRSMIASAVVSACNLGKAPLKSVVGQKAWDRWHAERHRRSLCCSDDKLEACAQIVGAEFADALQEWIYGDLGCGDRDKQQVYLDRIADLDEIRYEVVN